MSYKEVLRGLTANAQQNADRFERLESIRLAEEREKSQKRLEAISKFSTSLDGFIKDKVKKQIDEDKLKGKIAAIEQDMESREVTGQATIPQEDLFEYNENKNTLLDSKKKLNVVANNVLEEGGSFQEANEISNLSGWALYSFVQQKSKIAADNYEDWLKGEMQNNEDLELEVNGIRFTPKTAETLDQRNIALKALRRQYLVDQNLTDVNRALLDDNEVGFYDKVQSAHNTIMKGYEKDDAIDKGFKIRTDAVNDFAVNKDFEALLGTIKRTVKADGTVHNRKEALDETFKILESLAKTGQLSIEDLEAIQNQEIEIDGKPYKVGRWKTRWLDLADELQKAANDKAKADLQELEAVEKAIEVEWRNKVKEGPIDDDTKAEYIGRWTKETGNENPPEWMNDFLTAEDNNDVALLEEHLGDDARGYLLESDLYGMSQAVKEQYKDKVKSDQDVLKDNAFKNAADRAMKTRIRRILDMSAEKLDGPEFDVAFTNAEADYERLYRENLRYTNEEEAHKAAIDEVKDNLDANKDGVFDTFDDLQGYFVVLEKFTITKKKQKIEKITKLLETESSKWERDTLKAIDWFKNNKLPDTEEDIKEAREYRERGSKKIPEVYKVIARKLPNITAWDIMDAQLKLDQKTKGQVQEGAGQKNLEEKVLEDETLSEVNKKLTYKSNPYSIKQASIDVLDIRKYLDSTDDEIKVFNSLFNTDTNLMMPGLKLPGV
tara:strand:- start:6341 stop:8503 length:2163 start_codon:yes stop_codon:yes gene_type:complete